jgi:prepilin-type N-terminal cleavage/methylation domain-containing protein
VRGLRNGFTLLELMIAVVVVTLIAANVSMVLKTSTTAYESELLQSELDDDSSLAIDRIRLALMSSSLEDLNPVLDAGDHSNNISYLVSLGIDENAMPVFSDPERIALEAQAGTILWLQNPDTAQQRSMVWTRNVPQLLENELPNGDDDNGNGLADEEGLVFQKAERNVHVQLSVQRTDSRGTVHTVSKSEMVFCRN